MLHWETFVRVNHKNGLYFNMISFQNEANRVYVPDINIVLFKIQFFFFFKIYKWISLFNEFIIIEIIIYILL